MSNMLNKVLIGLSILLVCVCGWLYISNSSLEKDNIRYSNKIEKLESDLVYEQKKNFNLQQMNYELDKIVETQRASLESIQANRNSTLERIKEIENAESTQNPNSSDLPTSLVRLLDEFCSNIKGSDCPSP